MIPNVALCVTHAPWAPGRKQSLERLLGDLGELPEYYYLCDNREPNWAWSERIWRWGAALPDKVTHVVYLQDDVRVVPGRFWPSLWALLALYPDELVGLETIHPRASTFALGGSRAYRVRDCCIGVGYVWPRHLRARLLQQFLGFRESRLRPGAFEELTSDGHVALSEDTLMAVWAHATEHKVLSPLPTIIDHDLSVPSTYGHDAGHGRRPCPTWKDWPAADLTEWHGTAPPREAGWQYGHFILNMCAKYVLPANFRPQIGATPPHHDDAVALRGAPRHWPEP